MLPATQLWVGGNQHLKERTITYLQKIWCQDRGCASCFICKQIEQHTHHALLWLTPEKQYYTIAQMEILKEGMLCARSADDPFFCIIESADLLSPACANSLLKLLEEPNTGYHLILLTERPGTILPTITSRCVITTFEQLPSSESKEYFLRYFKEPNILQAQEMLKCFDQHKITEVETRSLCDELLAFWIHKAIADPRYTPVVNLLTQALEKYPMPGSAKIFWRTLYLNILSVYTE